MSRRSILIFIASGAGISGCPLAPAETVTVLFDFNEGLRGWEAGVADFSAVDEPNLNFLAEIRTLPEELNTAGTGLFIQSTNTPDDLFTFVKRRIGPEEGIAPQETYRVRFRVTFASDAPSGCAGIGGAPGESVFFKAGATTTEPQVVDIGDGAFRMNVDKGNQSQGGPAASVAGNVANGIPCEDVSDLADAPFATDVIDHVHDTLATADDEGTLWLLVGTDSGFEGATTLFYQRIEVTLQEATLF